MPKKIYSVELSNEERQQLKDLVSKGQNAARRIKRAEILLRLDKKQSSQEIFDALATSPSTVDRIRKRFALGRLELALNERPRPGQVKKLCERDEAQLIALACSAPPEGHKCWTMQLLADRIVELGLVKSFSDEAVRRRLKKTKLNLGNKNNGVFLNSTQHLSV